MNKKELVSEGYEAPQVEIVEVEVEQGFSASDPRDMPNGGNPF